MDPRQVFVIRSSNHQGSSLTANSRSYLNHFTQPDSIVPEPNNPQAYDRYSYAQNYPVRYSDPTGHSWEDCGDRSGYRCQIHMNHVNRAKAQWAAEAAAVAEYQARSWLKWFFMSPDYKKTDCTLSLLECYYSSPMQFMDFTEGQQIDSAQFNELLIAVYFDLKSMDQGFPLMPIDYVRGKFDTPFFGGQIQYRNELTQRYEFYSDTTSVCVTDNRCSNRNDINYLAQGMWGAAAGQSLDQAYSYSEGWKHLKSSALSVDAKYWIEYGYNKYLEFENSNLFDTLTHP